MTSQTNRELDNTLKHNPTIKAHQNQVESSISLQKIKIIHPKNKYPTIKINTINYKTNSPNKQSNPTHNNISQTLPINYKRLYPPRDSE